MSREYHNETDARIALQQAELAVDAGILELSSIGHPVAVAARRELEAETFEVREVA